ncbi:PREDICTED: olfactory receptor 5V1-like [Nanorana parkeri]|uniref:olfactory receptor 5V1-like n=1 Tax=Nanorana parkeri TaxID=125878 RepID=UPI000854C04C|nr:PREDICTED: olfactory receptor 5V1-like [Nanorana parkeri]
MGDNSLKFSSYITDDNNNTMVKEFILMAFSDIAQLQKILFVTILLSYMICISGNISIIIFIIIDPLLHTPMYIFIGTFAVLEIMFVTVTIPKLLDNLISEKKSISFLGCFTQLYFFNGLGITECYLLAIMAFDRDLAINNPFHYLSIMSKELCFKLAGAPWIVGLTISLLTTFFTARLKYCGPNKINNFVCDAAPLQDLSCSDPFISKVAILIAAVFAVVIPFIIIIGFYIHIINTILKIKSSAGKKKAFSTCSSHLIVASLYYGTAMIVYITPVGSQLDKFLALIYTVLTPLLNPFIYTLRNKDVKSAMRKSKTLIIDFLSVSVFH